MSDVSNSYDEVPYESVSLVETHPERLSTIATLFGLATPDVASCRVLELGCAGAGNLVPLAKILPNATFVGIDLSPRQIEQAEVLARRAGVTNTTFHAMSLTDFDASFGEFDYILCHGVYSWVPDDVKDAILRIVSENLSPSGVAYVSYNTFPGWHMPGMVREMMLYHVRKIADPSAKVRAARAFLDDLGTHAADKDSHYARILRDESEQLKRHADSYVLHEHLETLNHPIYFHEFAERASVRGLKVLGDARFWSMASSSQPAMSAVLDKTSLVPLDREQYLDFLTNRRFRRTLLGHAQAATTMLPDAAHLRRMRLSASVWPTVSPTDFASSTAVEFRAAEGMIRLSTIEPLFKTALITLVEVHPLSIPFDDLWRIVQQKLSRAGVDPGSSPDLLATRMLQAYSANSVELHQIEPEMTSQISSMPEAFLAARIAAETWAHVPTLRHRQITISEFDRLVIRQLDGTKTHEHIVEGLVAAVVAGQFTIHQNGMDVRDPVVVRPILQRSLEPSLHRLIRSSLIVS